MLAAINSTFFLLSVIRNITSFSSYQWFEILHLFHKGFQVNNVKLLQIIISRYSFNKNAATPQNQNKGQNTVDQVAFHLKVSSEEPGSDGNTPCLSDVFTFISKN